MSPQPLQIVVTGFGPFVGHEQVNASWEAVRALPTEHTLPNGRVCQLRLQQIEVSYQAVDVAVAAIWSKNPDLVIHCGVNSTCSTINLECQALNGNFCKPDWRNQFLDSHTAARKCPQAEQCPMLSTQLNVEQLVKELAQCHPNVVYAKSVDIGNYLCGYIYFKSLDHHADRTLFVHVPPVNAPFSTPDTTLALLHTIEKCLQQTQSTRN